jgi:uroporphyrinogen-III synthase
MARLLVTRPLRDAERTAQALRLRGHEVIVAPLLTIDSIPVELPSRRWCGILMTSANAARAICNHPRRPDLTALPVFVVGAHTAEAARAAGFTNVVSADADARTLSEFVAARLPADTGTLLYLAGEDRSVDLAAGLGRRGLHIETIAIYRARPATDLPPAARAALASGALAGVLHFSRRSAQVFLDCAARAGLTKPALASIHYCLSEAVAMPLAAAGAKNIRIAAHPEEAALLALIPAN